MTYYILANENVHQRLYAELVAAIPDPTSIPPWQTLEQLPYLWAVVRETLRMIVGSYARLARRNPDAPTIYRSKADGKVWTIPAGCGFGMSSYYIAYDPDIYPDPWTLARRDSSYQAPESDLIHT